MACTITDEYSYRGMKTIILENEKIRVVILADMGAKIHEFTYKPSNRDWMYHHPRVECRTPVFGVNVDNWWSGGMDEAIPTGHPCTHKGEDYPFLGEVWSLPWHYEIENRSAEEVGVYLRRPLIISPLIVERRISLRRSEAILRFWHRVSNVGFTDCEFLWGLHPGFSVNEKCRIDLPAETMIVQESFPDDRLGCVGTSYRWPYAKDKEGRPVDMRRVAPASAGTMDFHYAVELREGWLAVTDTQRREGAALVFPNEVFGCVWLWLVYGGWRGVYTAAVEAWTGYPAKLSDAFASGRCSRLAAGESLECESLLLAFTGFSEIESISPEGKIAGR